MSSKSRSPLLPYWNPMICDGKQFQLENKRNRRASFPAMPSISEKRFLIPQNWGLAMALEIHELKVVWKTLSFFFCWSLCLPVFHELDAQHNILVPSHYQLPHETSLVIRTWSVPHLGSGNEAKKNGGKGQCCTYITMMHTKTWNETHCRMHASMHIDTPVILLFTLKLLLQQKAQKPRYVLNMNAKLCKLPITFKAPGNINLHIKLLWSSLLHSTFH